MRAARSAHSIPLACAAARTYEFHGPWIMPGQLWTHHNSSVLAWSLTGEAGQVFRTLAAGAEMLSFSCLTLTTYLSFLPFFWFLSFLAFSCFSLPCGLQQKNPILLSLRSRPYHFFLHLLVFLFLLVVVWLLLLRRRRGNRNLCAPICPINCPFDSVPAYAGELGIAPDVVALGNVLLQLRLQS